MRYLVVAALLGFSGSKETVVFEAEGVRFGEALINDPVLQIKQGSSGHILVARGIVEPLVAPVAVTLGADRVLTLAPGIRVTRVKDGFSLTAHGGRKVQIVAGGETCDMPAPVTVQLTDTGWNLGLKKFEGMEMAARRAQDDADSNLDKLGDAARRILTAPKKPPGDKVVARESTEVRRRKLRRIFGEDPLAGASFFNSEAIYLLTQLSPLGF